MKIGDCNNYLSQPSKTLSSYRPMQIWKFSHFSETNFPKDLLVNEKLTIVCNLLIFKATNTSVMLSDNSEEDVNPISQDFLSLFKEDNDDNISDIQLVCQARTFKCHKAILTARSDVFAAMFRFKKASGDVTDEVDMSDADPEILEQMIHVIYSDSCNIKEENVRDIFALADKYNVKGLKTKCKVLISNIISHKNVEELHDFSLLHNAKKLQHLIRNFVLENWILLDTASKKRMLKKDEDLLDRSLALLWSTLLYRIFYFSIELSVTVVTE